MGGSRQPRIFNAFIDDVPLDAVLIGRASPFGNPFKVGVFGTKEECVEAHRRWIIEPDQAPLRILIKQHLRGRDLVCYCTINGEGPCHGHVLIEIANKHPDELIS